MIENKFNIDTREIVRTTEKKENFKSKDFIIDMDTLLEILLRISKLNDQDVQEIMDIAAEQAFPAKCPDCNCNVVKQ